MKKHLVLLIISIFVQLTVVTVSSGAPQQQESSTPTPHSCGCEAQPELDVLAIVGGKKISQQDLSIETRTKINLAQDVITDARTRQLDRQINNHLLTVEAKRRGLTIARLIELEVLSKVTKVTDAEAQAFYDKNKAQIGQEFKQTKDSIVDYLTQEREQAKGREFANFLRATAKIEGLVQNITPPVSAADLNRVFATVNGSKITSAAIEENLKARIYQVQQQVYSFRKSDLDIKINDILLETEAKKRGITARNLIDVEVTGKLPIVSEAQAEKFYNENKSRLNGEFARLKTQIMQHLQQQEEQKHLLAFADRLRTAAQVQIFLTPPQSPIFQIAVDDQPFKGNPNATVTVVQFTDFQCPSCATAHPTVEKLIAEFGSQVKFVIRDFPLEQHKHAQKAAEAAEIAREQGKYWEYIALLYKNQHSLEIEELRDYAVSIGLDREEFATALNSGKFAHLVERDLEDGDKLGVNGTPTFFVNGRLIDGFSYGALKAAIEAALKK
jgi:protein-disulfide isomerase